MLGIVLKLVYDFEWISILKGCLVSGQFLIWKKSWISLLVISLQLVHSHGSFLPYLIKRVSDKKKSLVNNLNICNTTKAKIFCLNCYQIKN